MPPLPKSLPLVCVALGFPSVGELAKAADREYRDGSNFLEFRLDYLPDPAQGIELIRKFRRNKPESFILATCRHKHASGKFNGNIEKQLAILRSSAQAGATLVDVEIETAEKAKQAVASLHENTPLVVSYHNFQNTPAPDKILHRLRKVAADVYKIATTARKPTDNLRLAKLLSENHSVPCVVLAMSEAGTASRILGPCLGSAFTYAAAAGTSGTAPGQICARTLRTLYRPEKLTKRTRIYGIIADPVSHTKSPFIHNRGFQARRADAVYIPFLVCPGNLPDWMRFATEFPVCGFSVTLPHKRNILRYLDHVEPLARRIGAVNTVWRKAGKWRGTNTDVDGVLNPLRERLRLTHASVLIAGYGGAARAAAVALHDAGAHVTLTGRRIAEAQALAQKVKGQAITLKEAEARNFDVLVHATPVGMAPSVEECLFRDAIPAKVVFDMVYNPHETQLLKAAKKQGCVIIPGAEMLLEQAIRQFEIWTGESAPREVMRGAIEQNI
jgi:3-dehydroquinate dehydratase/shikimate dehydrogenase